MTRSDSYRVESFSPGHRPAGRPKGWLTSVVARARIAGFIFVVLGFVALGYFSLVTGVSPAYVGEDGLTWVVTQATGDVRYRSGGFFSTTWQELRVGDVVGDAAEIRTGRKSRVVLGHRQTTMTATAESRVALPGGPRSNGAYRVLQSLGTLLYTIKERANGMAAFEVETPYLVALVKGTIFTVNASAEEASVELSEGVVRVQPTRGGKGTTLAAGQTARVTRASGTDVIINGPGADRRSSVKPQAPTRLAMANTQRTGPGAGGGNAITGSRKEPGKGRASTGTETLAKKARVPANRQVAALSEANRGDAGGHSGGGASAGDSSSGQVARSDARDEGRVAGERADGGDRGGDNPGGDGPRGGGTGGSSANTDNPGGDTGKGRASTGTETLAKKARVLVNRQVATLSEANRGDAGGHSGGGASAGDSGGGHVARSDARDGGRVAGERADGGDRGGDNPGGGGTGGSSATTDKPGGGTGKGRASTGTETLAKKVRVPANRQVAALSEANRGDAGGHSGGGASAGDPGGGHVARSDARDGGDNPGGDGPRGGGTGGSSANTGNPGGGTGEGGQAPGASPQGGNPGGGGTGGGTDVGGGVGGGDPGGGHVARSDWSQDTARGANTGRGTMDPGKAGRGKTATGSPTTIWSAPSMAMETAEDWMAEIWAAVTEGMDTWVGAVLLLVMWAVVWVAVSTLRISFTRTKKLPSRDAAAMARGRVRQPA